MVETAVVALLESGAGLTREQAQQALNNEDSAPTPTSAPSAPSAGEAPHPAPPSSPPRAVPPASAAHAATELESWFALRYGAVALGTELGVAHGPGLELGLGVKRGWFRVSWDAGCPCDPWGGHDIGEPDVSRSADGALPPCGPGSGSPCAPTVRMKQQALETCRSGTIDDRTHYAEVYSRPSGRR